MPPYENVTIYHMRDLVSGTKKIIKADGIRALHVPQYETLTIKKILAEAKNVPDIMEKMPDNDTETFKFPKSYVCNICYTVLGENFKECIKEQINIRNEKVANEENLLIDMDKDIANAFYKSNAVSL